MDQPDVKAATDRMKQVLARITDDQLDGPTPCPDYRVGDLIQHVGGLSLAFTNAAQKGGGDMAEQTGTGDASLLETDWRTRIPADLDALGAAWRDASAWAGMTRVGGMDLPGDVAGAVTLDEVLLHGWDLARATGHDYDATHGEIEACLAFVGPTAEPGQEASREGIFGPVVPVAASAPAIDRLVGLAGRDPQWSPPAR